MGTVVVNGHAVAVAIAVQAPNSEHDAATAALSRIAIWIGEHLDVDALPASPCR
jgi:ribosomal protein S11